MKSCDTRRNYHEQKVFIYRLAQFKYMDDGTVCAYHELGEKKVIPVVFYDSGHGGIFQNHDEFVKAVIEFLTKQ